MTVRSRRVRRSWKFLSSMATVPKPVSTAHPMTSLTQIQSSSPAKIFFQLTNYFSSSVKDGKIHLRDQMVPWRALPFSLGLPFNDLVTASI